ncbi:uncharacterized protein LOC143548078 [Bidens hawaiensis]|uniref:uncharacterized protein LOC143548078 n=1 Tax=Bidens hawaiensis TaxID=980011 RepID=UPI0040490CC9
MDPTTPPPQDPHTPTDQNGEPSTARNMNNFKSLVFNLAGRLLPADHQPLVERRFDEILPRELLVPEHPPYADMILTALWELKSEGGSSEEDVSNFIKKEYHELPWAHATILNHHLKDLCKQGKITMTHDRCYILGSSTTKPESSPGSSPSPVSSSYSSSSTSVYSSSSTSSSCSSLSWGGGGGLNRRRTRNNGKKKTGRVRTRGRGRGRGRGRSRSRSRNIIYVEDESEDTSLEVEDLNEVTSLEVEDLNEVTNLEVEDQNEATSLEIIDQNEATSLKIKDQNEATSLEIKDQNEATNLEVEDQNEATNLEVEDQNEVKSMEVKHHKKVTSLEVEDHGKVTSLEVEDHNKVTRLEVEGSSFKDGNDLHDVSAKISEEENLSCEQNNKEKIHPQKRYNVTWIGRRVRRLKEDEVDIVNEPSDDEVTMLEADVSNAKVVELEHMERNRQVENQQCDIVERQTLEEEQVTSTSVEKQHDDTFEEQVETKEQPLDDDDVVEGAIDPQDQCAEKTEEPLQPYKQDELENLETESTKYEERQTEADQKEIMLSNVQQEPLVEISEQQAETSKKDSLKENTTSSGSTTEGPRRTRQGLRSSSKTRIKTEEPFQSCKQDELENMETESTKCEEHQTEADQKEIVLSNVQQEPLVEIIEQETETSKKNSLQENTTSSGSTTEGPRRTRQGLRSSSKTRIKTEEPLQSCKQDELENVETESAKHEEHHPEANLKEIVTSNVQQEPLVEIIEQETEISKKDSLQENTTSSGSTTEGPRRTRQGLRSGSKKEDADASSHSKTPRELVTPVRRSLRSNKTSSEPAVISEAPENSKEQEVTYSGRTRASKRKPGTAEAEQVSSTQKTRRTGL